MTLVPSRVDHSSDILSSARNLQKKDFQLRSLRAGVWDLGDTEAHPPEECQWVKSVNPADTESVIGEDERVVVPPADFVEGGKYRSIVKIFAQYEYSGKAWAMGTGWLIRPDLMVTAGHIAFNHGAKYGRATVIKAYIGYAGKTSIGTPGVQFRKGIRCVTTADWLSRKGAKPFDVSWIKLDKPFTGVTPIEFMSTPASGISMLGVVGYPGDLEHNGERGALMHSMFVKEKYNLAEQDLRMLEYTVDTFGGNSGSPVFLETPEYMKAIGVHVYGGPINSASVIGLWGNPFEDYVSLMAAKLPADGAVHYLPASQLKGVTLSDDGKGEDAAFIPLDHGGRYLSDQKSQNFGSFIDDVWNNFSSSKSREAWNSDSRIYDRFESQGYEGDEDVGDNSGNDHAAHHSGFTKTVETTTTTTTTTIGTHAGGSDKGKTASGGVTTGRGAAGHNAQGQHGNAHDKFQHSAANTTDSRSGANPPSNSVARTSGASDPDHQSSSGDAHGGSSTQKAHQSSTQTSSGDSTTSSTHGQTNTGASRGLGQTNTGASQGLGQTSTGAAQGLDQKIDQGSGSTTSKKTSGNSIGRNVQWDDSSSSTEAKHSKRQQSSGEAGSGFCSACGKSVENCTMRGKVYDDFMQPPPGSGAATAGHGEHSQTTTETTTKTSTTNQRSSSKKSSSASQRGDNTSAANRSHGQNATNKMGSGAWDASGYANEQALTRHDSATSSSGRQSRDQTSSHSSSVQQNGTSSTTKDTTSRDASSAIPSTGSDVCMACGKSSCPFAQNKPQDFQTPKTSDHDNAGHAHFWTGAGSDENSNSQSSGTEGFTLFSPKGLQATYTKEMAAWQLGTAPWHPPSTKDVKLGQLGCFNNDGTWQVIADITNSKDVERANGQAYDKTKLLKPLTTNVPEIRSSNNTDWSSRVSTHITGTDVSTNAKVDAVLPVNAEVKFTLKKDKTTGAILVVENPIGKLWFESGETAFKRWIDDNVDALKTNWSKELDRGLWLLKTIITTKTAYISVLNSSKKEISIGGGVTVPGFGGASANVTRKSQMKTDGWELHTSKPGEERIVFMSAFRYKKGTLWGINHTESVLTEESIYQVDGSYDDSGSRGVGSTHHEEPGVGGFWSGGFQPQLEAHHAAQESILFRSPGIISSIVKPRNKKPWGQMSASERWGSPTVVY